MSSRAWPRPTNGRTMAGMGKHLWRTGQQTCHAADGAVIPCAGSGQDGEWRAGAAWPQPRFRVEGEAVEDRLTGLTWLRRANPAGFPLAWTELEAWLTDFNAQGATAWNDWRAPDRRELRSLIDYQARDPALPPGHPFREVYPGWYWTSTRFARDPGFVWWVQLTGGRMFYSHQSQYHLLWPVRGAGNGLLTAPSPRAGSGGAAWPQPRFAAAGDVVRDRLTGLTWTRRADLAPGETTWTQALATVAGLNRGGLAGWTDWRLPNINELESLVDCDQHTPALSPGHPFVDLGQGCWSSTTSLYEPDWAWALYLDKGACGVGQKKDPHFRVWAVRG